jgi:hypothetical protein
VSVNAIKKAAFAEDWSGVRLRSKSALGARLISGR